MKKLFFASSFVMVSMAMVGADFRRTETSEYPTVPPKKKCVGYTIIEFGKGIDCNGDTVKLVKRNGVQVLASIK